MYRAETEKADAGVAGNARITGATAAVLLGLLAAEGATVPFVGELRPEHVFIGLLLIPPVALKLGSTGYRFARYYSGGPSYRRKGPPAPALRLLAPGVVITTVALFATGVALIAGASDDGPVPFLHKLSFIAWFALMTVHVLAHLLEVPRLAAADWRRSGPREARLAGAGGRLALLGASLLAGVALAWAVVATVPLGG